MTAGRRLGRRLMAWFRGRSLDREFEAELTIHLAMLTEENVRRGMSPDEARRAASIRLGGTAALVEQHRAVRGVPVLDAVGQDLRSAYRSIVRSPRFSAGVVGVLTLGLGLSAAVFSIVNGVFLKPLPYPEADRLVWMWGTSPRIATASVTPADYVSYRDALKGFEHLAASVVTSVDVVGDHGPERVRGAFVSWNFFDALGVPPQLGRTFTRDEERQAAPVVAILSQSAWHRLFGGAADIVGRQISLNRQSVTVVGVMPAHLQIPVASDMWLPLPMLAPEMASRSAHFFRPIGRLRDGVSIDAAQAELHTVSAALAVEFPDTNTGWTATVVPLRDVVVGRADEGLRMLWTIVGCVLLLACANAAGLLMARVLSRQREFAVRLALGASAAGVIRQVLVESVILAVIGGLLGLAVARWGVQILLAINPGSVPLSDRIGLDGLVVAVVLALSALTGLVAGLPPALQARRPNQRRVLRDTRVTVGPVARRALQTFVVVEFALALILVTGSTLAIGSFVRLSSTDTGFRSEGLVTGNLALSPAAFPSAEHGVAFWERLLEETESTPGVESAAYVSELPFSGQGNDWPFYPEGQPPGGPEERVTADFRRVSVDYFATMGIPLTRGRYFAPQESRTGAKVAAISETLAERYFPGTDPIGKRLMIGAPNAEAYDIVAVVGDVRHRSMRSSPFPAIYVPNLRVSGLNLVARATDEATMTRTLAAIVASVDRDQPVARVSTMTQLIDASLAPARFSTHLLSHFGVIALVLAAAGLFGVMAFSVTTRTKDIGIRMALGARPGAVRSMVLREGLWLAILGLGIGVPGVLVASRLVDTLFPVTLGSAPTVAFTALILLVSAGVASYVPARRATRVNPATALRQD